MIFFFVGFWTVLPYAAISEISMMVLSCDIIRSNFLILTEMLNCFYMEQTLTSSLLATIFCTVSLHLKYECTFEGTSPHSISLSSGLWCSHLHVTKLWYWEAVNILRSQCQINQGKLIFFPFTLSGKSMH